MREGGGGVWEIKQVAVTPLFVAETLEEHKCRQQNGPPIDH
jgi:hypothetical protein